jgi:hypothetical protein
MNWSCGLSTNVPVLQVQSPEFKLQFHQNNKDNNNKTKIENK